jgi:hypothetical protein
MSYICMYKFASLQKLVSYLYDLNYGEFEVVLGCL